jgi:hypothetical protein
VTKSEYTEGNHENQTPCNLHNLQVLHIEDHQANDEESHQVEEVVVPGEPGNSQGLWLYSFEVQLA